MTDISFAPKEVIPQEVCRLEVLAAEKVETYGPQIGLKLKVVEGEHEGHTFTDYANRDKDTGQIKQGGKAWSMFEACLARDFYRIPVAVLHQDRQQYADSLCVLRLKDLLCLLNKKVEGSGA
jgi:hypothetical protein